MKCTVAVLVALSLLTTPVLAAHVYVGNYDWNVSQSSIDIPVYISGDEMITAVSLAFSVGDGGPLLSGSETILIKDIAPHTGIAVGTIWNAKSMINDLGYTLPFSGVEVANMAIDGTGSVVANGLVATVSLQSPDGGLAARLGQHLLLNVNAGESSGVYNGVSTVTTTFGNGTLTLVPEPASLTLAGLALLAYFTICCSTRRLPRTK